jgi:hypothetical protein
MAKRGTTKEKARDNGKADTPAVIEGRLLDPFATGGEIPGAEPEEPPTPPARRGSRRRSTAPAAEGSGMRAPSRRRPPRGAAEPEGRAVDEAELRRCSVCGYVRRDPHDCPGPQT